jgi:6-phosphofructokinase 2
VAAVKELLQRGPDIVVLSLGKDGAVLGSTATSEIWRAKPPAVRTDSAVGSGDSLVAGFLAGWFRTRRVLEAFRLGVACGTASAMTPGTELCHRADIYRLLPRVLIKRID